MNGDDRFIVGGNFFGLIYKGGVIVPIIQTLLLTVLALSVERFFAIRSAQGKGKLVKFVADVKATLSKGDIKAASALCEKQQGSVANVLGSTLIKYAEVEEDKTLSKEQQILAIQKEVEEATALELPMLSQNLPNHCNYCNIRNFDGSSWYCNWYDQIICCSFWWWWY